MRILELISGGGVDGVSTHVRELSLRLIERGHEITLLCRPDTWIESRLAGSGVEFIHSMMVRQWPELRRIAALVRQRRFDVMHTHQSRAHFFGVLVRYLSGRPVVATAHSTHLQPHFWFNDHVFATSEATGRYHRWVNMVPRRRITTVHNFVDLAEFAPMRKSNGVAARRALGLDADSQVLMAIGTIGERKNQLETVSILANLRSDFPRARLVLMGDAEPLYKRLVEAKAGALGVSANVIFAGRRNDVRKLLPAADVVVLTSRSECLPMAIIEAMAAARPVVAYAVGGIGEMIVDGVTGGLVRFGDQDAFERRVRRLLADPAERRRQGLAAVARVRDHFSHQSEVRRIEDVFAHLFARFPHAGVVETPAAARRRVT